MPGLITVLVVLLVFCLVYWAAVRLMAAFGVGEPIHTVVVVVLIAIAVVWLVRFLGVDLGF
jgi:hypothetical protein